MDVVTLATAWVPEVASACGAVTRVVLPLPWSVLVRLVEHRATLLSLALRRVSVVVVEGLDSGLGWLGLVDLAVVVETALLALLVDEVGSLVSVRVGEDVGVRVVVLLNLLSNAGTTHEAVIISVLLVGVLSLTTLASSVGPACTHAVWVVVDVSGAC